MTWSDPDLVLSSPDLALSSPELALSDPDLVLSSPELAHNAPTDKVPSLLYSSRRSIFRDTSSLDAYGDDTSMAEHSPAAGPDDLHSPGISGGLAGEGATTGKHKKYRIIRQRNKATTTFDWTTTTTKTTSTTATAMAKSKGAGGKK